MFVDVLSMSELSEGLVVSLDVPGARRCFTAIAGLAMLRDGAAGRRSTSSRWEKAELLRVVVFAKNVARSTRLSRA